MVKSFATLVTGAAAADHYAKGFVRMPRNAVVPVGEITDEMRSAAPASLDWTTQGATTPVKDQGQCGSCWAYSATEGIESGLFMATKNLIQLAEQQIVSCDKTDGGCNGGDLPSAFDYVESAGGIDLQSDYPDTSGTTEQTGSCKWNGQKAAVVTGYKYAVSPCDGGSCSGQDENGLMASLAANGPLSVCVNAQSWNGYYGGVMDGCSGAYSDLDHCVQLVGYDNSGSQPYWKVRNSWGTSWGENGYIRLAMGSNNCGIADEAMYVQATAAAPSPPTPPPAPTPTPSCVDTEDTYYCNYVVQQGWCGDIGGDCLSSCGCCDDPSLCGVDSTFRAKVLAALEVRV